MHVHPVARVYAEALLAIARDRGQMDALGAELAEIAVLLGTDAEVRQFLANPALPPGLQKQVLERAMGGQVEGVLVDFLCLLIDKGRIGSLGEIAAVYRDLADTAAHRARIHAASATALPAESESRLLALLRERLQSDCILETAVQPELLGGLVLTIGDTIYDGSVRGALRRMHNAMRRSGGFEN